MQDETGCSSALTRWLGAGDQEHREALLLLLDACRQTGIELAELEPAEAWLVVESWRSSTDSDQLYVTAYAGSSEPTRTFQGRPRYTNAIVWQAVLTQLTCRDPDPTQGEDACWHGRANLPNAQLLDFDELVSGGLLAHVWSDAPVELDERAWFAPAPAPRAFCASDEDAIDG